jgi:hypothetical protein
MGDVRRALTVNEAKPKEDRAYRGGSSGRAGTAAIATNPIVRPSHSRPQHFGARGRLCLRDSV